MRAVCYNKRKKRFAAREYAMFEKICKLLAEQLNVPVETIRADSEVVKDLGADSLDVVELMMALEDEYGVTFPEGEIENVRTVQDIVDLMNKLTA